MISEVLQRACIQLGHAGIPKNQGFESCPNQSQPGFKSGRHWLPDMDLNHDKQIQSLLCYRYTIGQSVQGQRLGILG